MNFSRLITLATFLAGPVLADTICAPEIPKVLDPHQVIYPLEQDLASKLYLPLIGKENQKAVAKSWVSSDGINWKVVLNEKLKFQSYRNWRSTKPISAEDVAYSIQRQLKKQARSLYEEMTFLPARRANLDYKLKEIKVLSPTTMTLTFWQPVSQAEFENMFSAPVGYVVSADFGKAAGKGTIDFFPPSGESSILETKTGYLTLATRSSEGKMLNTIYKEVAPELASVKRLECDQFYYPTSQMLQELKGKKSRFFQEKLSRTKLFLIVNPDVSLSPEATKALRNILAASKYPELKTLNQSSGLFTGQKPQTSSATFKLPPQKLDFYYCDLPTLSGLDVENLVAQISAEAEKVLNLSLIPNRTSCEMLPSKINHPMAGLTLSPVIYKTEEELANEFICSYVRSSTGFCLSKLTFSQQLEEKKKLIQTEFDRNTYVVPLIEEENQLLEF